MDVLLLAGYRQDNDVLGLEIQSDGRCWMDHQISVLKSYGLNPVVVLSGDNSDQLLRVSREIQNCDLIFDTNGNHVSLFSNLQAGLLGCGETCFLLPIEVPCPEKDAWIQLRRAFQRSGFSTKVSFIQLTDAQGAPWHCGFPLLVTRLGKHLILNDKNINSLTHAALKYDYSLAGTQPSL